MIKLEKTTVYGLDEAIRGMRNPMNSWKKSESGFGCGVSENHFCGVCEDGHTGACPESYTRYIVGENDHELMMKLAKGGPVHAKYRRMIVVYVDITAPLYWWKEFDTYKVGTTANSCSTMHKIHAKEFTLDDFSCEKLLNGVVITRNPEGIDEQCKIATNPLNVMKGVIESLNCCRLAYLDAKEIHSPVAKNIWDQMIQLLPSSYNQKRTVMLNYEVLTGIYPMRKNHKLDEWHVFCDWIKSLPYSGIIVGAEES